MSRILSLPIRSFLPLTFLFAFLACLPCLQLPGATLSFVEPSASPLVFTDNQAGATGIASADFNGDGFQDLAVTHVTGPYCCGFLSALLGNGDGTFQAPITYKLLGQDAGGWAHGYGIASRDFDGDAMPDLAVASPELKQILFYKGRGDGTFQAPVGTSISQRCKSLQSADLDGNGKPDLVTVNEEDGTISILLGKGDGAFGAPVNLAPGNGPKHFSLADLDGKSGQDIVVALDGGRAVAVFLNDGAGTFPPSPLVSPAKMNINGGLFVADFDGDGRPDAAAVGMNTDFQGGNFVVFMKGGGDGTFATPAQQNFQWLYGDWPTRGYCESTTPDLNGDGRPDIIFGYQGNETNQVTAGFSDGDGTFALTNWIASPGPGGASTYLDKLNLWGIAAEDFDGDAVPDLAVAAMGSGRPGGVSMIFGKGQSTFAAPMSYPLAHDWVYGRSTLGLGDFDEDGKFDALALTTAGADFFKGNGDCTFQPPASAFSLNTTGDMRIADFDGDGHLDLACRSGSGYSPMVLPAFGAGDGTFVVGVTIVRERDAGMYNLVTGDFNHDGRADLAFGLEYPDGSKSLEVYLCSGSREFTKSAGHPEMDTGPHDGSALVAADFDGDGNLDLAVQQGGNPDRLLVFRGKGDGTFHTAISDESAQAQMFDFTVADLNGDSKLDLVAATYNEVYVFLGKGDATFEPPVSYPHGTSASQIALADLDGDGKLDLAVAHGSTTFSDGFAVLLGNGDGTFGAPARFAVGNRQVPTLSIADLDGDGKRDVVVLHNGYHRNNLTVLKNDSGPRADLVLAITQMASAGDGIAAFVITVSNRGPDAAENVRVRDPIRRDAIFIGASPSQGTWTIENGVLLFNLGTIASGSVASITVRVQLTPDQAIPHTASASSDIVDPNLWDNTAVSTAAPGTSLAILGPGVTEVGGTYDYVVTFVNLEGVALQDVAVVFSLPSTASYVPDTTAAIYYPDKREVFWKVASLAPYETVSFAAKIRVPWGIPAHTAQQFRAYAGWMSPGGSPFDASEYFAYQPHVPVSARSLTPAEIDATLAMNPAVGAMYAGLQGEGFQRVDVGRETTYNTGDTTTALYLVRPNTAEVAFINAAPEHPVAFQATPSSLRVLQDGLEILWDANTLRWTILAVPPARGGDYHNCMMNCLFEKLGMDLVTKFLGDWAALLAIPDCVDCLGAANPDACTKCVAQFPFAGEVLDIKSCLSDCTECQLTGNELKCHNCKAGDTRWTCEKAPWWMFLNQSGWAWHKWECQAGIFGKTAWIDGGPTECAYPQGVLDCDCSKHFCKAQRTVLVLSEGETCETHTDPSCPSLFVTCGEVRTAHDPNAKYGPSGDIVAGQRLEYGVECENEGEGTAYGVYIMDYLDPNLDETTLVLTDGGSYSASSRRILWNVGELAPGGGALFHFSICPRGGLPDGTQIVNQAKVVFPSVPETTPTDVIVSTLRSLAAKPLQTETLEDTPVPLTLEGVDPQGGALAFNILSAPVAGTLDGAPPQITYVPGPGYEGPDSFTFSVSTSRDESLPARVDIIVKPSGLDTIPPSVRSPEPPAGTLARTFETPISDGAYAPYIRAYMDDYIDPATVTAFTFHTDTGAGPRPGTASYDGSTRSLLFIPSQPLVRGALHTVTVETGIRDTSGNALAAPFTWSFTAIPPGDCDGSGGVSIGEVQKAINMFLGTLPPDCGVNCNGDGTISIGEVQKVINAFLGMASECS